MKKRLVQCFELHADKLQQENIRRFSMSKKDTGIPSNTWRRTKRKASTTSNTSSRRKKKSQLKVVAGKQCDNEVTDENTVVPSNRRMHSSSILDVTNISKEPQSKKRSTNQNIPPNIVMRRNMNRMTYQRSATTLSKSSSDYNLWRLLGSEKSLDSGNGGGKINAMCEGNVEDVSKFTAKFIGNIFPRKYQLTTSNEFDLRGVKSSNVLSKKLTIF